METFPGGHALVVQVSAYQQLASLPAVSDGVDLVDVLVDPHGGGYDPANVILLRDGEATRSAVLAALERLAGRTHPDATALVFFSGHGGRLATATGREPFLLPADTRMEGDQPVPGSAIPGADFSAAIAALPAGRVLVLLDCCHAGGVTELGAGATAAIAPATTFEPGLPDTWTERLAAGQGRVVLSACRADEQSWVQPGATNGVFTEHLVDGLRGAAAADDGFVRVFDLFEYVQPRVTGQRPDQHPTFRGDLQHNFAVTRGGHGQDRATTGDGRWRYDAYLSYAEADDEVVWDTLVPWLENAGLLVAVSRDVEEPGVARVTSIERGLAQARRTVVLLSDAYLDDHVADFENSLAQTMGLAEGQYRLVPVRIGELDESRVPARLSMLTTLDLVGSRRPEREYERLLSALQRPVPRR